MFQVKPSWEVRVKIQDQVTDPLLTPKGVLLTSFRCVFFRWISFRFPTHNNQPKKKRTHQQAKKIKTQPEISLGAKKTNRCFFVVSPPHLCLGFHRHHFIEALPATDHGVFG